MARKKRTSIFVNSAREQDRVIPHDTLDQLKQLDEKEKGEKTNENNSFHLRVQYFMQLLEVEIFFIILVVIYGIMTFVQMGLEDTLSDELIQMFNTADLILGGLLLIEIILKFYAFGFTYFRNCWNAFDAVVVILSFALSLISAYMDSLILLKIFRLRIVLRFLRVLVVFERVKAVKKVVKKRGIESPLEHVLRVLSELQVHPGLHPRIISEVNYCSDIIRSNKLYETGADLLEGQDVDKDMEKWLKGEIMKSNVSNSTTSLKSRRKGVIKMSVRRTESEQNLMPLESFQEHELNQALQKLNTWDFDIFRIEEITDGNALSHIGLYLFNHQDLEEVLGTSFEKVSKFFMLLQKSYISSNPYHNAVHGADVMQNVHYFLQLDIVRNSLSALDLCVALISAAAHDVGHNGLNNAFHTATMSELAIRYNDNSILENYHVSTAFNILNNSENMCNIFENLSPEDLKYSRLLMIEMILATDMSKHFAEVGMFKTKIVSTLSDDGSIKVENEVDKRILMKLVLHTSDISNPAKPRFLMLNWTDRVVEEFFRQGEKELENGLPVSPFMDRRSPTLMKSQLGFIDFIVKPLFELWAEISQQVKEDGLSNIIQNRAFWVVKGENFQPSDIKGEIANLVVEKEV